MIHVLLLPALVLALAAPALGATPADPTDHATHAHHHDAAADTQLQGRPGGGRWATDAPLRTGMARVHSALVQALAADKGGGFDGASAQALAAEVRAAVAYMVANCQLEPAADADLHVLIGQMLAAVEKAEQAPADPEGLPALHAAVERYGEHFDHPGLHDEAH